jgi:hypothetical protein
LLDANVEQGARHILDSDPCDRMFPIIMITSYMITSYGDAEIKRQALDGAEAPLTKPIDLGDMRVGPSA